MNAQFDKAELESEVPLGRLGTADEIADAVMFFAENGYATGQVLGVNGGIV
jgi:3-oxoacyl-[acyl-carrier protein] reductase